MGDTEGITEEYKGLLRYTEVYRVSYSQGCTIADEGLASIHGLQYVSSSSLGMKDTSTGLIPVLVTTNILDWGTYTHTHTYVPAAITILR